MMNFNKMMKQAQQLQTKMAEMQNSLQDVEVSGTSGGGMVTVVLNGKGDLKSVTIDPSLMNPSDADVVSDLVVAAFSDAKTRLDSKISEEMSALAGKLGLPPGFQLPF